MHRKQETILYQKRENDEIEHKIFTDDDSNETISSEETLLTSVILYSLKIIN